jgi:hypothetical protein
LQLVPFYSNYFPPMATSDRNCKHWSRQQLLIFEVNQWFSMATNRFNSSNWLSIATLDFFSTKYHISQWFPIAIIYYP